MVRVGSRCLNHPALVQKHPTHLASSVLVWFVLYLGKEWLWGEVVSYTPDVMVGHRG